MNNEVKKSNRFDSIDGLRVIACIGIVLMHIKSNISYSFSNSLLNTIVGQFGNLVFLFMAISSFAMCCGYFKKIQNHEISPEKFYSKRIGKLLPFFIFLILVDVIIEHNIPALIEGFADSTLLFGLLQKQINVIGVAWFLGLIFIFYIMFPYFTYLFSSTKRASLTTIVAILMNISCIYYFNVGSNNMFYSFIYFCIGGLLYTYKDSIIKFFSKSRLVGLILVTLSIILFYIIPIKNNYLELLRNSILSIALICYAISYKSKFLSNNIMKFIGNISFEIYLCHMVVYRLIEKVKISNFINNKLLLYICTFILVIVGSILIATIFKQIYSLIQKKVFKNENTTS